MGGTIFEILVPLIATAFVAALAWLAFLEAEIVRLKRRNRRRHG